jgi:hypothetical protein
MEMWELFLKGLAKTFEEFTLKMIEKGKEETNRPEYTQSYSGYSRPSQSSRRTTEPKVSSPGIHDIEKLQSSILEIISQNPGGITMKNIASGLNVQWHFLRVPMRQLQMDGHIIKNNLNYYLADSDNVDTKQDTQKDDAAAVDFDMDYQKPMFNFFKEVVTHDEKTESASDTASNSGTKPDKAVAATEASKDSSTKSRTGAPRRRVIDASQLKDKPKTGRELSKEEIREQEILRFRVLTALRGRPEGLSKDNIALIVGEKPGAVEPVLADLEKEAKVVQKENDMFRLP